MIRKDLTYERSNSGILNKYNEAMNILEYSVMLVKLFEIKEFNNVIAGQLRLILCDTTKIGKEIIDNSLIRKIQPNPKLFQVNDLINLSEGMGSFIPCEMFNYDKPTIPLEDWLNQVVLSLVLQGKKQDITIRNFIKFSANKSGGAHVDPVLREKAFIVDVHSDKILCDITIGLFRSVGRDLKKNSEANLAYLIGKYKEKAFE
ncbi:hypothetical protein ABD91_17915 [Lysinibacillus sphaericus]|uniref:hypothetical protein n=1 Tax=Lysinibacillus sphaericus TaxID=1421 RepID=UPI0018CF099A|nr:hypothetical protein [Lysinibacillus sphaericus]MBG9692660.1 hypothetical protein [Lysinibacillus sphaericus]